MTTISITGIIKINDEDEGSAFSIDMPDYGWQQWGAYQERLYRSVPILEAMVAGLQESEVFLEEITDDDEDNEEDLGFAHTQGD